jgi:hypothetical protein
VRSAVAVLGALGPLTALGTIDTGTPLPALGHGCLDDRLLLGRARSAGASAALSGLDGLDEVALAHLGGAADAHARGQSLELGDLHGRQ